MKKCHYWNKHQQFLKSETWAEAALKPTPAAEPVKRKRRAPKRAR